MKKEEIRQWIIDIDNKYGLVFRNFYLYFQVYLYASITQFLVQLGFYVWKK